MTNVWLVHVYIYTGKFKQLRFTLEQAPHVTGIVALWNCDA